MNDGLNAKAAATEQISVGKQLDHLNKGIGTLEDTIQRLSVRLAPVLPPVMPTECEAGIGQPGEQQSEMMNLVTQLTGKLRRLNSTVCHLESDVQV